MSMTENEAIELGKNLYENLTNNANNIIPTKKYIEFVRIAIKALEEIQEYMAIGTVEEFKLLKEKNEPKKPIETGIHYQYKCPSCGSRVTDLICGTEAEVMKTRKLVCQKCIQKLDWQ